VLYRREVDVDDRQREPVVASSTVQQLSQGRETALWFRVQANSHRRLRNKNILSRSVAKGKDCSFILTVMGKPSGVVLPPARPSPDVKDVHEQL
jgi:hypothetical protein